eukprot:364862-Chlamydomonas_euryale.AAC.3
MGGGEAHPPKQRLQLLERRRAARVLRQRVVRLSQRRQQLLGCAPQLDKRPDGIGDRLGQALLLDHLLAHLGRVKRNGQGCSGT